MTRRAAEAPPDPAALTPEEAPLAALEETLPFSYARPAEALAESIAALGLLRPPLALRQGPRLKVLAGNLRVRALKILGRASAPVVFLPPDTPPAAALALALADNSGRRVNQAETALVWRFLVEELGPGEAVKLAGPLGLAQAPKLRDRHYAAAALPPRALEALAEGRLDLAAAARLAAWPAADQESLLDFFETLAPTLSQKRDWLDWLEDLARRDGRSPAEILADPDLTSALGETERRGRQAAEAAAREMLFRRRHPLLAAWRQKRAGLVKSLRLPPAASLSVDPSLEDLRFSLTLTFEGLGDFQALADLAGGLKDEAAFRALLDDSRD